MVRFDHNLIGVRKILHIRAYPSDIIKSLSTSLEKLPTTFKWTNKYILLSRRSHSRFFCLSLDSPGNFFLNRKIGSALFLNSRTTTAIFPFVLLNQIAVLAIRINLHKNYNTTTPIGQHAIKLKPSKAYQANVWLLLYLVCNWHYGIVEWINL